MKPDVQALAFFDLDGTLLNKAHDLDPEVVTALHALRANGVLPIIATGRMVRPITGIMARSGIDSVVAMNGQYVQVAGQPIFSQYVAPELVARFAAYAAQRGVDLVCSNAFDEWALGMNAGVQQGYGVLGIQPPPLRVNDYEDVHMLMSFTEDVALDAEFGAAFPELMFYRNFQYDADVVPRGVSKVTGITRLQDYFGRHLPTYAFGDGPNDLEMLTHVDHGIAMGNGTPAVKAVADFVAPAHDEGGILVGLRHYDLI